MKRISMFCLAAVLLLSCLSGCGTGGGTESSTPVLPEESDITTTDGNLADATTTGDTADTTTDSSETGNSITEIPNTTTTLGSSYTQGGNKVDTTAGKTTVTTVGKATTTTTVQKEELPMVEAIKAYLSAKPQVKRMAEYDPTASGWANIQAITYDGATIDGQKTKVYAYIGFPEGASTSNKVPAVVLVHGGGGHAFAEWVKIWNDRGYAAIAMDTTGCFPTAAGKGKTGNESDSGSWWQHGMTADFQEVGYVNAPYNDEMQSSSKPLEKQWMYHAVVSTIMANNILRADSRVDAGKIGITGISWGGIISSIAIGYDTRYAFAIPVYGSGYLDEAHSYMGGYFSEAATKKLWSAAERFDQVDFPVMWLGYSSDVPFSINSNSKSYMATKAAGAMLNMKVTWGHSHGQGWAPEDIYIFADSVLGRRGKMTTVTKEPTVTKNADGSYNVTMTIAPAADATNLAATAAYITSSLSYTSKNGGHPSMDQSWKAQKCTLSEDNTTITVTLPKTAVDFYIFISTKTADGKYDVSSQFVEGLK